MNRTIRNLVIAVPLATVGLTMVNTAAATAGPNGPVIIGQPKNDPQPPNGPKDIKDAPKPPKPPAGPKDIKDAPKPKKPAPKPQAQPQAGNQTFVAPSVDTVENKVAKTVEVVSAHGSADSIDRADYLYVAGPAETELAADTTDDGKNLTWLLVGGGIVTASGIAFAARKRSNA